MDMKMFVQTGGVMMPITEFEFNVDEQYENEKGVFTVLSIHRDEMVIRWESGEEIRTDIDLQCRIQIRRQWEEFNRKIKERAGKKGSGKSRGAKREPFVGFLPTDFKETASGTKWRARNQLGSDVTQKLPRNRLKINSWAFAQHPEIHWMDMGHRTKEEADYQSRFFVRLNQQVLTYGFCTVRPDEAAGVSKDWDTFINWLSVKKNEQMVHTMAADKKLTTTLNTRSAIYTLDPCEGGWQFIDTKKNETCDSLTACIDRLPVRNHTQIEFVKTMEKAPALERGLEICDDISKLFALLMPLYLPVVS